MVIYTVKFVVSGRETCSAFRTREEAERMISLLQADGVEVVIVEHLLHS